MYRQDSPLSFDEDTSSWYLEQTPAGSKDLCDRCEEVLSLAASDSTSKASVHHQSAGSFFKAADGSCLICSYLYGKIPWKAECFPAEILEAIVPGAPFSTYSVYRTRLEIRLEWLGESYDPGKGLIWSLPYPLNRNAPPSFVSDRPTYNLDFQVSDCKRSHIERNSVPSAIGLAERIPQIKSWLGECDGQHSICRSLKSSSGYIPTRLLDVGSLKDPYVRLLESQECSAPCRYVTLSHCWGPTKREGPARLLQANYAAARTGITNLPRTFLEAVEVARHLQVRYLWIDSLCIIQDSPQDWESEVSQMDQIYANSYCNIAAAGARNTTGGLYLEQNPRLQPPWRLYLRDANSQAAKLIELSACAPFGDEFAAAALNSRAWAMQERLLAPRTLHFTRKRLYWDCGHSFTWEGCSVPRTACQLSSSSYRPSWVTPLTDAKLSLASLLHRSRQHAALAVQAPHDDKIPALDDEPNALLTMIHAQWTAIVAHYTTLSLAKRTDKLFALAGLAKLFQSLLEASSSPSPSPLPSPSSQSPAPSSPSPPSSCLAETGILLTNPTTPSSSTTTTPLSTHHQLLWRRARTARTNPLRDTDAVIAPTWSWASLDNTSIVYPGSDSTTSTSSSNSSSSSSTGAAAWLASSSGSICDYRATIAPMTAQAVPVRTSWTGKAAEKKKPSAVLQVRGKVDRSFWRHAVGIERLGGRRASGESGGGRRDFVHVEGRRRTELRIEMDVDEGGDYAAGGGGGYSDDDDDDGGAFGELVFLALVAYKLDPTAVKGRRDARVVEGLVLERAYTSRVKDSWQRVGVFACEYAGITDGVGGGWRGVGGAVAAVEKAAVGKGSAEELYQNFLALPDKSVLLV
ncbi:Heterokaryon incompatibility [Lasiodiplodia theobromae]|nr:Heterokaryon incompatibility [Lasiodiplodia theobromae]